MKITPDKYERIPEMLRAGMDRKQIAAEFGVTWNTLQVQCSRRNISLDRRGRLRLKVKADWDLRPLELKPEALVALRQLAGKYGTSADRLATRILEEHVATVFEKQKEEA